jgi:hypothetical protein
MIAVGIDPGKHGGIAVIEDGVLIATHRMPRSEADAAELINTVSKDAKIIAVERVTGWIPGRRFNQNASRMFVMGWWTGGPLFAAYLTNRKATRKVMAFKWQRDLGLHAKGDKGVLADASKKFFGAIRFNKQVADAVLIAVWAWNTLENSSKKLCTFSAEGLRSHSSEKQIANSVTHKPTNTMSKKAAKKTAAKSPKAAAAKTDKVVKNGGNYILSRFAKQVVKTIGGEPADQKALRDTLTKPTKYSKLVADLPAESVTAALDAFFAQFNPVKEAKGGATPEPAPEA